MLARLRALRDEIQRISSLERIDGYGNCRAVATRMDQWATNLDALIAELEAEARHD